MCRDQNWLHLIPSKKALNPSLSTRRRFFLTLSFVSFRGDVDDRVLPEAILPLLEALAASEDVRPILHRRFDMPRWLASHGITSASVSEPAKTVGEPFFAASLRPAIEDWRSRQSVSPVCSLSHSSSSETIFNRVGECSTRNTLA